jgi:endonuclease-3
MNRRLEKILEGLEATYPSAECELRFRNPLQLLIATILSAQSTDKRVNMVTPALFRRYRTARAFARAKPEDLEELVHSTGFFRNKAKHIREAAAVIDREHGGKVPEDMEALLRLPGVARKTANVVLGVAFGKAEGVVVDTHVQRISRRLGFTRETQPDKIERELMKNLPRGKWILFSHLLIHHGRAVCKARRPECARCTLADLCESQDKTAVPEAS